MRAEMRFRSSPDCVEVAMVRPSASEEERRLRPPAVKGNPDVAVRVHQALLSRAVADPQLKQDLAPMFAKLLKGRSNQKEFSASGSVSERIADSTKWSIDLDWLTLDFKELAD
jgi:hypothetical protein